MITVKIGHEEAQYHLVLTTAGREYDGFGTITIHETGPGAKQPKRFVLVHDRHLAWQVGRYQSGMYRADVQDERAMQAMRPHIETQLWRRLEQADRQELV